MQICKKEKEVGPPPLVAGNIYQHVTGMLYIYTTKDNGTFVNLTDGNHWPTSQETDVLRLTDVTDKYCLQEK